MGYDGELFDCDFNQMLGMNIGNDKALYLRDIPARIWRADLFPLMTIALPAAPQITVAVALEY